MPRDDFEEKSHYSYAEMMERLKESRSGSGGSGRGKKRRRSEQTPIGKSRKFKIIAISGAFLVILALAVPVAIFMMSRGQYTTDAFRRSLNDRVSALTGKSADFGPFRMQGTSLFSQKLELLDESDTGWIHQARLTGLRADFGTTLHQGTEWPVKKLVISSAQVVLGHPSGKPSQLPAASGVKLSKPLGGLDPSPTAIVLSDLYVRQFDLAWGRSGSYETLRQGTLQTQIIGGSATWQLADAKLRFGELPALSVARLAGDFANDKITIEEGIIGYTNTERGTIKGEITLATSGGVKLALSLKDVELKRWLDLHHKEDGEISTGLLSDTTVTAPWEERIKQGRISINGEYVSSFEPDAPAPSIAGTFVLDDVILRNWHLFYSMGLIFNESRLNSLNFKPFTGKFHWQKGLLTVTDVQAEDKGLLKLEGSFTVTSDPEKPKEIPSITGTLRVGLPAVDMSKYPGGQPDFFSPPIDGFSWTTVNFSGPLDEPRHDFLDQLPDEIRKNLPLAPWELPSARKP